MGVWGFYRATWSIPGRIFGAQDKWCQFCFQSKKNWHQLFFVAADPSELRDLISVLEGIEERLVEIQGLAWTSDFGKE